MANKNVPHDQQYNWRNFCWNGLFTPHRITPHRIRKAQRPLSSIDYIDGFIPASSLRSLMHTSQSSNNFWICYLVSLGQIAFGYPSSIIGTTLGEPSFLIYMGIIDPTTGELTSNGAQLEGAMSGVFQAGAFFGVLFASWVMDRYGRKAGMIYCAFFSLLGGALLTGANGVAMFIVARFFAGIGSWGFLAVTPTYSAELAPPKLRGFFVGMNGINIALGYGLASYMGMAFYYAPYGDAQWRGPLGIALLFPFMMLLIIFLPFVPESPRFLLMRNRIDEAREVTMKLHSMKGDPEKEFARSEFYQMEKQAAFDRTLDPSWIEMFRRPSYRKRTFMAMGFAFLGQSTAVLVINNYGPLQYEALGFGTEDQLRLQCGWISVGVITNAIGAAIMDKFGRRPLMLFGVFGCCVCLIIEAAMVAAFATGPTAGENRVGLAFGVVAFYAFLAVYGLGIDVCGVVWYSEVFPNHIRAKGICLSIATIALTDLVYLQATATAFANIGWKFYLLFICICFVGGIIFYFLLPETRGIPLEEIAKIFGETEDIMVFSEDLHIDRNTHELVVDQHGNPAGLSHIATEEGRPVAEADKEQVDKVEEKV